MRSIKGWVVPLLAGCLSFGAAGVAGATALHTVAAQASLGRFDNTVVPRDTRIGATMNDRISTRHSHVGDRFTATVTAPVRDIDGRIAIPAGAQLTGRVYAVRRGHGRSGRSQIELGIDGVTFAGVTTPVIGTVTGSERLIWRSGARSRERSEIPVGAGIKVNLDQSVRSADLLRGAPNYGIGGGPR